MARSNTEDLLEMVDEGIVDQRLALIACLKWMSDQDVGDMMELNGFLRGDPDFLMGPETDDVGGPV